MTHVTAVEAHGPVVPVRQACGSMERTRTACLALARVIRPHDARWPVVPAPQVPCCGSSRTSTPPAPRLLANQTAWTAEVSSGSNTTGRAGASLGSKATSVRSPQPPATVASVRAGM